MICRDCKMNEANKWCPQCGERLCVTCLRAHKELYRYALRVPEIDRQRWAERIRRTMQREKDATR